MKRVRIIATQARQIEISTINAPFVGRTGIAGNNWNPEQLPKTYRNRTQMRNSPSVGIAWTVGYQKHESSVIIGNLRVYESFGEGWFSA
jgi:hypothetical protein